MGGNMRTNRRRSRMFLLLLMILCFTILSTTPVFADVLDVQQTNANGEAYEFLARNTNWAKQSFVPETISRVTRVDLKLKGFCAAFEEDYETFDVIIHRDDGTQVSDVFDVSIWDLCQAHGNNFDWYPINLNTHRDVTPGRTYWVWVDYEGFNTIASRLAWARANGNVYPDGEPHARNDNSDNDFTFKVYGPEAPQCNADLSRCEDEDTIKHQQQDCSWEYENCRQDEVCEEVGDDDAHCVDAPEVCTDNDDDGFFADCEPQDCNDNNNNVQETRQCNYNGNACGNFEMCVQACPLLPAEECNGVDDDCDNEVDEECPVIPDLEITRVWSTDRDNNEKENFLSSEDVIFHVQVNNPGEATRYQRIFSIYQGENSIIGPLSNSYEIGQEEEQTTTVPFDIPDEGGTYVFETEIRPCSAPLNCMERITITTNSDSDGDGIEDEQDNCPNNFNHLQEDNDEDGVGNACDVCLWVSDPEQEDTDEDGLGDACDKLIGHITTTDPTGEVHNLKHIKVTLNWGDIEQSVYTNDNGGYIIDLSHEPTFSLDHQISGFLTITLEDNGDGNDPYFKVYGEEIEDPIFADTVNFRVNHANDLERNIDLSNNDNINSDTLPIAIQNLDDYAMIYFHTRQAVDFALNSLDMELDFIPVEVFTLANGRTNYCDTCPNHRPEPSSINIGEWGFYNPNRPDNREWHEFSHHIMADSQIGGDDTSLQRHNGDSNHGGYQNHCTSDSFSEGFAEYNSGLIAGTNGDPFPECYGAILSDCYFNLEHNWKTWSPMEEIAVAGILWDLHDGVNLADNDFVRLSIRDIWDVLNDPNVINVTSIYHAFTDMGLPQFIRDTDGDGINNLDEVFVSHGAFSDANGNQRYDPGERIGFVGDANRPNRNAMPPVPNSYLNVEVIDRSTLEQLDISEFRVDMRFNSPHDYLDMNFAVRPIDNRLSIVMPPPEYIVNASISFENDEYYGPESLVLTGKQYWELLSQADAGHFLEHTFYVNPIGENEDTDEDGIVDANDNCPLVRNRNQEDVDNDGLGDACDNEDNREGCEFGNPVCDENFECVENVCVEIVNPEPDLIVNSFTILNKKMINRGKPGIYQIALQNIGDETANEVSWKVDIPKTRIVLAESNGNAFAEIAPQEVKNFNVSFPYPCKTLRIEVDPNNAIDESNENNNNIYHLRDGQLCRKGVQIIKKASKKSKKKSWFHRFFWRR